MRRAASIIIKRFPLPLDHHGRYAGEYMRERCAALLPQGLMTTLGKRIKSPTAGMYQLNQVRLTFDNSPLDWGGGGEFIREVGYKTNTFQRSSFVRRIP